MEMTNKNEEKLNLLSKITQIYDQQLNKENIFNYLNKIKYFNIFNRNLFNLSIPRSKINKYLSRQDDGFI